MSIPCPACGYQRKASDIGPDYECIRCGIVFEKWKENISVNVSDSRSSTLSDSDDAHNQSRSLMKFAWIVCLGCFFVNFLVHIFFKDSTYYMNATKNSTLSSGVIDVHLVNGVLAVGEQLDISINAHNATVNIIQSRRMISTRKLTYPLADHDNSPTFAPCINDSIQIIANNNHEDNQIAVEAIASVAEFEKIDSESQFTGPRIDYYKVSGYKSYINTISIPLLSKSDAMAYRAAYEDRMDRNGTAAFVRTFLYLLSIVVVTSTNLWLIKQALAPNFIINQLYKPTLVCGAAIAFSWGLFTDNFGVQGDTVVGIFIVLFFYTPYSFMKDGKHLLVR